jgi:hypothetical protein
VHDAATLCKRPPQYSLKHAIGRLHGNDAGRHSDSGAARHNPIHEDDIIATISKLLEVGSVPAITVNWAGDQTVSLGQVVTALSHYI